MVGTAFLVRMLNAMGAQNETALFLKEQQKRNLLRGLFDAFYLPQAEKAVIFLRPVAKSPISTTIQAP